MSANRHLGRIISLQTLYEIAFRLECGDKTTDVKAVLKRNIGRYRAELDDKTFVNVLVNGVIKDIPILDERLQPIASDWPLNQIAKIDLCILRMGAFEMLYHQDVPPKVVINEAVELAKAFGGDNSSKFVNGVLGTLLKQIDPSSEESSQPAKKATKAKPDKLK